MNQYDVISSGYELADAYIGQIVKVFHSNGTILTGTLLRRKGKYISLKDKRRPRPAMINLDDISSMT